MVKIRSFISKKSVPRGISIDNKEYWQPFGVTVKGKNNGGGGGGDVIGKCNITIVTNPSTATIVAIDSKGNQYTSKQFSVDKGVQVTIIATPSSTGYKTTRAVISSQQTNYDNFTYTLTLDIDAPVVGNTSVTVLSNISGTEIAIYDANDVKLNNGNNNYAANVPIGSVIKISTSKSGYELVNSSHGTISKDGDYYNIRNIIVVENLTVNLEYSQIQSQLPTISGLLSLYNASYESQVFTKVFRSEFHKIKIYGDLALTFSTAWQDSVPDSLGIQSITDDHINFGEQEITFVVSLSQNITGLSRDYNFTVVAENENGDQVTQTFKIRQGVQTDVYRKVSIAAQINGVDYSGPEITRIINGTIVAQGQEINVLDGTTVTFYCSYLGVVKEVVETITSDTTKTMNFTTVNISLGTVTDNSGRTFDTWDLTLYVDSLNLVREHWRGELIPVVSGTEYRVTGIDTSGYRPNYDSGIRIATGSAINIVFSSIPSYSVFIEVRDNENRNLIITNANIKLKVGTVEYNNGYAFDVGTKVGYIIQHPDYETATLSDASMDAIIAGVTPNPIVVYLISRPQYVDVTVNTYLNGSYATNAEIYLDNVLQGTGSPYVLQNLVNGSSHNLTVRLDGQLDHIEAFVATLNGVINVDYGVVPTHYSLAVTMLDPSDALIEVNDYTDGTLYTGIGELYKQIGVNHEITIEISKEGYMPKHMPANANNGGRIIMNDNKNYLNQNLDEVAPSTRCTYQIIPTPSDAIVEFSETENGAYVEYPSKIYTTFIGRTVYWRVSKQGYVTQMGNSGVLEGNKQDTITLQAEQSNVNNNVLFAITSIKDKDTNEDLTGVTVNLRLKNVDLPTNKTITQSDIEEVVDNPGSQWNQYLGLYGGVSAKGTNVEITIAKTGYETYNHSFSIPVDYEGNVLGIDVKIQTPKCDFTLYPIQDLGENNLIPDAVYIREGDDNFTENDRIQLVANRYKLQINRGANVYYLVLKTGYGGGYGSVSNVNLSQTRSVTLLTVSAPAETVTLRIYGTNDGTKTLPKTAASQPILFDLEGYNVYSGSFVGGNYYAYDFTIPKNVLVKAQTIWGNKCVSLVGSFSKNAEVLMWFAEPNYPNYVDLRLYPMVEGEQFMNNNNNFNAIVNKVGNSATISQIQGGNDTLLHYRKTYSIRESVKIHIVGSIDGYANIIKDYPFGDITTLYMNFVDNPSQESYLRVRIDGSSWYAIDGQTTIQFDGNGDTHNIQIESNEDWVVE